LLDENLLVSYSIISANLTESNELNNKSKKKLRKTELFNYFITLI
jgi:hypothetical protein